MGDDENWDEEGGASTPAPAPASNENFGMNFGMGRGFKPVRDNYESNEASRGSSGFGTMDNSRGEDRRPGQGGFKNNNDNDFGSKGFGDSNGFGAPKKGFGDDNQSNGFGGGSRGFGGGNQFDDDNRSGGRGGGRGGRGRGGRGGGGFNRDNDNNGYGGGGGRRGFNDDNEGGGGGGRRGFGDDNEGGGGGRRGFGDDNDGGGGRRGGRGGGRGGRSGGYGNNNNDDDGGYGGGSRGFNGDSNDGGGGRRGFGDNDGGGGRRGFGDDSEGGGGGRRGFGDNDGGGGRRGGRGGGRGGRSGGYGDNNDDDGGYGGGSRGFNGDDNDGGGRRGGRGGGRGGGYGNRDRDENGYGGGSRGGGRGFGDKNGDDGGFGDNGGDFGGGDNDGDFGGDGGGRGRGRGRGGRGGGGRGGRDGGDRGGGGFGRDGGDGGGDGDQPEKPREIYIPKERTDDELFDFGVEVGINFSKYDSIEVKTSGEDVPPPITSFAEANLRSLLQENINKCKYTVPTPVQKYALPILFNNRDLMACAQTGSGKTAAFLIPIIHRLLEVTRDYSDMSSANNVEPRALIISPTRELTIQIYDEARKFAKDSVLKCQVVYGGTSTGHQMRKIFSGCDILVATPGRLLDLVGKGKVTFNSIEFVVLDEADRMLDMGFIGDVEKVLQHDTMPPAGERQTLMFSATFPEEIQQLAAKFLNNYIFVAVGIVGSACTDIEQNFFEVEKKDKRSKLKELLEMEQEQNTLNGILVFVDQKRTADFIAAVLSENNFPTTSIHGDRLQREREEALLDFKTGRMSILVATAVAARGLDIKNVRHVINFDLPKDIDEYIHRIGRTGRVGNKGKATSFYDPTIDNRIQTDLLRILTQAGQEIPPCLGSGGGGGSYGPASNFGGQDIRSFSDVQNPSQGAAQPVEDDDDWN